MQNLEDLLNEAEYATTTSGGPGGQHANRTETKVILKWNLESTTFFTEEEKERLQKKLENQLTNQQELQLSAADTRSQATNKQIVSDKFLELIKESLKKPKKRKPIKVSKQQKLKRLKAKKKQAEKKELRKKVH